MRLGSWHAFALTARAYLVTYANNCIHKGLVASYLIRYAPGSGDAGGVVRRAVLHDLSKYRRDEARAFVRQRLLSPEAPESTPEFQRMLIGFERQVELHYARNPHHPEHHARGYAAMAELDRIEMIADWAASARRRTGADLRTWILGNAERYGYGERESAWMWTVAQRMGAT